VLSIYGLLPPTRAQHQISAKNLRWSAGTGAHAMSLTLGLSARTFVPQHSIYCLSTSRASVCRPQIIKHKIVFQSKADHPRMLAFSSLCSLSVTWQRWRSHRSIRHSRKTHATRKLHGFVFYRTGLIAD